mmetsp:Transcript_60915/g.175509  ORF Transcript_60915/g.175509 Transcript_60915/m.175509 type:complete len:208 (-) Transcript_60915:407-1030(-)
MGRRLAKEAAELLLPGPLRAGAAGVAQRQKPRASVRPALGAAHGLAHGLISAALQATRRLRRHRRQQLPDGFRGAGASSASAAHRRPRGHAAAPCASGAAGRRAELLLVLGPLGPAALRKASSSGHGGPVLGRVLGEQVLAAGGRTAAENIAGSILLRLLHLAQTLGCNRTEELELGREALQDLPEDLVADDSAIAGLPRTNGRGPP